MAKAGSESAAEELSRQEIAGEYRPCRGPAEIRPGSGYWGFQTKLHRWAGEDEGRRFDDLYNLVCDPAFLTVAWERVRANKGGRTAGVDGQTARSVEQQHGG